MYFNITVQPGWTEGITDKDYQHAHTVWKKFNIESMKDYHKLYNLSDVPLLADIFENFRSICMNHYGLDPAGISVRQVLPEMLL